MSRGFQMTKTVLIVEDDQLNMKLFDDILQSHGYNTLQSADGIDLIEIAQEHQPNLIIMDIKLPHQSGLQLTKLLKSNKSIKDIPVIAVTAFVKGISERIIREAGCVDYLQKP